MSNRFGGQPFQEGASDFYISGLGIELDNNAAGIVPFKATIGRLGVQTTNPYIFKRRDNSPYFSNERWDNGNWMMDGVVLNLNVGQSGVRVFAGKHTNRLSGNGVELQPIGGGTDGFGTIESTLGVDTSLQLGTLGNLSVAYLLHSENGSSLGAADRIEVYGGQLGLNLIKGVDLVAGYSKSNLKLNNANINNNDNEAIFLSGKFNLGGVSFDGGYRRVENNYNGQGTWSRIGTNWSPKNIRTFNVNGNYKLSDMITLNAGGEFGETLVTTGGIPAKSDIKCYTASLDYTFNEFWNATLGYEEVKVEFTGSSRSNHQKWGTLAFGYNMNKNSMLKFTYQYGSVFNQAAWGAAPAGDFRGSIVATQLSVKF